MSAAITDRLLAEVHEGSDPLDSLSDNSRRVLNARYLKKNEAGECIETPAEMFRRVARTLADVELQYGEDELARRHEDSAVKAIGQSGVALNLTILYFIVCRPLDVVVERNLSPIR